MYSPQNRQVGSAFALTYKLLLRSCKLMGVFVIPPLLLVLLELLQTAGPLRSTDIAPLPRYYGPFQLPLVFRQFPVVSGYMASRSAAFHGRSRRVSPVAWRVLVIVLLLQPRQSESLLQSVCGNSCCLRSSVISSTSGV